MIRRSDHERGAAAAAADEEVPTTTAMTMTAPVSSMMSSSSSSSTLSSSSGSSRQRPSSSRQLPSSSCHKRTSSGKQQQSSDGDDKPPRLHRIVLLQRSRPLLVRALVLVVGAAAAAVALLAAWEEVHATRLGHPLSALSFTLLLRAAAKSGDAKKENGSRTPTWKNGDHRCSCYDSTNNANGSRTTSTASSTTKCCQRAVLKNHKFGMVLTERLFKPYEGSIERLRRIETTAFPLHDGVSQPDYRHAVLVRNYFEAFVSGYLYHKSGRECWLTMNGRKRGREQNHMEWDVYVNETTSTSDIGPHPPRNGRSICRYLADEPTEVGMKVYIAVALRNWYSGLDGYHQEVQARQNRGEPNRTIFLCLGDYHDKPSQEQMFYQIMDWLYPGGHNYTVPKGAITASPTHEGHASSNNATERHQLLELVERLDRDVFRGALSATNARFGCQGTIRRTTKK